MLLSRRAGLCFLLLILPGFSLWAQPEASPASASQLLADAAKRREEMREQLRVENEAKLKVLQQQLEELDKELVSFKPGDEAGGDLKRTIFDRHIQDRKIMQARVLADPENITKGGLKPSLNLMLHALEYFLSMKPIGANTDDPLRKQWDEIKKQQPMITAEQANRIRVKRYGVSSTRSQNLNTDHPLKFDRLPAMFREPRFEQLARDLEKTGETAMNELRSGKPVSYQTQTDMLNARVALMSAFNAECRKINKTQDPDLAGKLVRAVRFVKDLDRTVKWYIEANIAEDASLPRFYGGSLEQLIRFMSENRLEFDHPQDNTQYEFYVMMFRNMRIYFLDLALADRLRNLKNEEMEKLKGQQESIIDSILNNKDMQVVSSVARSEADAEEAKAEKARWSAILESMKMMQQSGNTPPAGSPGLPPN